MNQFNQTIALTLTLCRHPPLNTAVVQKAAPGQIVQPRAWLNKEIIAVFAEPQPAQVLHVWGFVIIVLILNIFCYADRCLSYTQPSILFSMTYLIPHRRCWWWGPIFATHCTSQSITWQAVLVVGSSGSGKTTWALHMIHRKNVHNKPHRCLVEVGAWALAYEYVCMCLCVCMCVRASVYACECLMNSKSRLPAPPETTMNCMTDSPTNG